MFVQTKLFIDRLSEYFPMMDRAETINFMLRKLYGSSSTTKMKKWETGAWITVGEPIYKKLEEIVSKCPNFVRDGVYARSMPIGGKIAIEHGGGHIKVVTDEEWRKSKDRTMNLPKKEASGKNISKDVEILAEIATVEHANGLKLDNLCRLMMKTNEKLEELCEAWKGKA